MNTVALIGRIGHDLELKHTNNGKSVVSFNLAVNRGFGKSDETDWIRVTAWEKTAENLVAYQGKGSMIAVSGRIQTRQYQDKNQQNRTSTEVVANQIEFLAGGKGEQGKKQSSGDDDGFVEELQDTTEDDMPF